MASEVEEEGMPDWLTVGPVVSDYGGGHVVENQAQAAALKVLEGTSQTLQERGLTFVAVDVHPKLARGAQQTSEHVDYREDTGYGYAVGRPVDLYLLTRRGFETALDRFA